MSRDLVGEIDAVIHDYEVSADAARYLPYQPATVAELATARQLGHLTGLDGYAALAVVQALEGGERWPYQDEYAAVAGAQIAAAVDAAQVYLVQVMEQIREPMAQAQAAFAEHWRETVRAVNEAFELLLKYGPDRPAVAAPKNGPPQHGPGHRAYGRRSQRHGRNR